MDGGALGQRFGFVGRGRIGGARRTRGSVSANRATAAL